jgi:putative ABC transport system ATP-binding protein
MVAIMGSSGSGKSTLLNIIGILDEADSGDYVLDGVEIKDLNEKKAANYRNQFLGFVFQSFNLINYKTAMENVALPLYYQGLKRKERQEKAMFHLEKVGLAEWAKHLPSELSGGQKQRVAIARALASEPKLLLADEPTGALDTATSHDIMQFLQQLNDEGKTILLVTHEEDIAKMCKRIVRLRDGVIIEDNIIKQVRA